MVLMQGISLVYIVDRYGFGHHITEINPAEFTDMIKWLSLGSRPIVLAVALSKSSFALTLWRVSEGRAWRLLMVFIIVSMCALMSTNFIMLFCRCRPLAKQWDPKIPGDCFSGEINEAFTTFAAAWSAAMDFFLALLACKLVYGLQMRPHEKLGLALAMSMGFFAGATACVKTYYMMNQHHLDMDFTCKFPLSHHIHFVSPCEPGI
jgi:hypothetical protein